RRFDGFPGAASFLAMVRDPILHLPVKRLRGGDKKPRETCLLGPTLGIAAFPGPGASQHEKASALHDRFPRIAVASAIKAMMPTEATSAAFPTSHPVHSIRAAMPPLPQSSRAAGRPGYKW